MKSNIYMCFITWTICTCLYYNSWLWSSRI